MKSAIQFQKYEVYGLRIHSQLSLPELRSSNGEVEAPHVQIVKTPIGDGIVSPADVGVLWKSAPNQFEMEVPGVARFLVSGGAEIRVNPEPGARPEDVRIFLLGSALAAALHQRQLLALHASCVKTPVGAFVFTGKSGSGKSSISAGLRLRGHPTIADDVSVVRFDQEADQPFAAPGFPGSRLCQDSAEYLEISTENALNIHRTPNKFALPIPLNQFCDEGSVITRAYTLEVGPGRDLLFEPQSGMEKSYRLTRHTYRRKFLDGLGLREPHFVNVARLVKAIEVTRIVRPQGFHRFEEILDRIEEDISNDRSRENAKN